MQLTHFGYYNLIHLLHILKNYEDIFHQILQLCLFIFFLFHVCVDLIASIYLLSLTFKVRISTVKGILLVIFCMLEQIYCVINNRIKRIMSAEENCCFHISIHLAPKIFCSK